jgi:hypothetical protein
MRTLAAIVAYVLAAVSGLAAGYYATAPRAAAAYRVSAPAERHEAHRSNGGPADLEAVAAFLAAEERRGEADPDVAPAGL